MQLKTQEACSICQPQDHLFPGADLFRKYYSTIDNFISLRSLSLDQDLSMIYDWVNRAYAIPFWQMNGPFEILLDNYRRIQKSDYSHAYLAKLKDQAIALLEVYRVSHDELREHVHIREGDFGMHMLMCPPDQRIKGLSPIVMNCFLHFCFANEEVKRIYGEPDILNRRANELVKMAGFQWLKSIQLSYKKANLYCCEGHNIRDRF